MFEFIKSIIKETKELMAEEREKAFEEQMFKGSGLNKEEWSKLNAAIRRPAVSNWNDYPGLQDAPAPELEKFGGLAFILSKGEVKNGKEYPPIKGLEDFKLPYSLMLERARLADVSAVVTNAASSCSMETLFNTAFDCRCKDDDAIAQGRPTFATSVAAYPVDKSFFNEIDVENDLMVTIFKGVIYSIYVNRYVCGTSMLCTIFAKILSDTMEVDNYSLDSLFRAKKLLNTIAEKTNVINKEFIHSFAVRYAGLSDEEKQTLYDYIKTTDLAENCSICFEEENVTYLFADILAVYKEKIINLWDEYFVDKSQKSYDFYLSLTDNDCSLPFYSLNIAYNAASKMPGYVDLGALLDKADASNL